VGEVISWLTCKRLRVTIYVAVVVALTIASTFAPVR
jgi:hypothetical protein